METSHAHRSQREVAGEDHCRKYSASASCEEWQHTSKALTPDLFLVAVFISLKNMVSPVADRLRSALCKASQFIRQLGKGRPRNDVSDLPLQIDEDDVFDKANPIDSNDVAIDQDLKQIRS
ncbi:hypothetical protein QOT17_012985 [Balamuthia mandrillaris]